MKYLLFLSILFSSLFSLTLEESKHLLNRTSFGYTKADLEKFSKFSKEEAVNYLITGVKNKKIIKLPENLKESSILNKNFKNLPREERRAFRKQKNRKMQEVKVWWYKMMLDSRFSFRERMTLFWHNHFVSEYKIVKSPYIIYLQNKLYRDNALGRFDNLLYKSSKDLAMLIYLDSNSNKKGNPNENYARELLELFTLGEGNYTEDDIKEAARAFTGLRANKKLAISKFVKKHHDSGQKTFMGKTGNFNGDDIIKILLKNEQTSKFITYKLYKEFINHEEVDFDLVNKIAKKFRASNYDLSVLMKNLLLSKQFWNNKSNMIKSPVEMIVSLMKALDFDIKDKERRYLIKTANNLGQDLFNPPSVQGWIGGKSWIDSTSLVTRKEFIELAIKRKLNKKKIKNLRLSKLDDAKKYFFSLELKQDVVFKNRKKDFVSLLTNPIYQIK